MSFIALCDYENTIKMKDTKLSQENIDMINEFLINNNLCILSNASFLELENDFKSINNKLDYFSFKDQKGKINNEIIYNIIDSVIINKIIATFNDTIYTLFYEDNNNGYIYNYQERLLPLYPKKNLIIDTNFNNHATKITAAIKIDAINEFEIFLNDNMLDYYIYAKDKNRALFYISSSFSSKEKIVPYIKSIYSNKKTVGISDSIADYDFLKACDYCYIMKNSDNLLKQKNLTQTKLSCEELGCMKTLLELDL